MKKILVFYWMILIFVFPFSVGATNQINDSDFSLRHTWPLFAGAMVVLSALAVWSFAKFWDGVNDRPKIKKNKKNWKKRSVA